MSDRDLILKLARVIIAVAWADGQISNEEINSLKDLLFRLRTSTFDDSMQFSAREWARLDMYIETPIGDAERARLVADLQNALRSPADKQIVNDALQDMIDADGEVSQEESELVTQIQADIDSVGVGGFQRLLGGAMKRRSDAVANAPNREAYFDDFIKNKVYYAVEQRLHIDPTELGLSDDELRKLSLVGGLMAKIAQLDHQLTDAEFDDMESIFRDIWSVSHEAAAFVVEVAVSAVDATYDTFRMMRELATGATEDERRQVVEVLFAISAADGDMSIEETEEIRVIARGLNLTHKDFIDAKLKVLGEERPAQL
ncbi:MAG TPA: TerB family tellurite resistance protein [Anaerolineae bacterium]|jgi:uncharacterized tellurite resistance protein B-like protein|nr:TerB family tellurite resistance protein [Anaerolineae bacterium]